MATSGAFFSAAAAAVYCALPAPAIGAEPTYPVRPVRIVVPNTAGSATDIATRMVGQRLTEALGQQMVIDNRAGAGEVLGIEIAAKAPPDGYTLLVGTVAGVVINPLLRPTPYDPHKDLTPVSLVVISPQMLFSHPGLPVKSVEELLALARAKPGQLLCASPGVGTTNHLGCELLKLSTQVEYRHVPYKGTTPAVNDVIGGQVQFMFNSMPNVMPFVKAGKLRALGLGGTRRAAAVPDLPLISETVPGFQCITWYAMYGPRDMPAAVVRRLNGEMHKMYADQAFAKRIVDAGQDPQASTPEELTQRMRADSERWSKVIKTANIKVDG